MPCGESAASYDDTAIADAVRHVFLAVSGTIVADFAACNKSARLIVGGQSTPGATDAVDVTHQRLWPPHVKQRCESQQASQTPGINCKLQYLGNMPVSSHFPIMWYNPPPPPPPRVNPLSSIFSLTLTLSSDAFKNPV